MLHTPQGRRHACTDAQSGAPLGLACACAQHPPNTFSLPTVVFSAASASPRQKRTCSASMSICAAQQVWRSEGEACAVPPHAGKPSAERRAAQGAAGGVVATAPPGTLTCVSASGPCKLWNWLMPASGPGARLIPRAAAGMGAEQRCDIRLVRCNSVQSEAMSCRLQLQCDALAAAVPALPQPQVCITRSRPKHT